MHCYKNTVLECWLVHNSARQFVISKAVIVYYQEHCDNSSVFCTTLNSLIPLYDCVFDANVEFIEDGGLLALVLH